MNPIKEYIPFGKPNFSEEEIEAVARVMRSGWIGMGQETIAFEQELAEYLGAPHVVTVNSCTSALFLSLLVQGIGQGDEVICPSLTWCATANVILQLGAKVVFCDVDEHTLSVTPDTILAKVTDKTKAVMVVHFGGLAMEVEALRRVLPSHIAIIEDAAHAFGARFENEKRVGSSGNLTCFSFYANKNLSTGEGGAIALADESLANRLRSLRQNAIPVDAWNRFVNPNALLYPQLTELGYKMNYTDLLAAIGRVQLRRQASFADNRTMVSKVYLATFKRELLGLGFQTGVESAQHAKHLFSVSIPQRLDRDDVARKLRSQDVGVTIHYAPLHLMPLYRHMTPESLPTTESHFPHLLSLPISASISREEACSVAEAVSQVIRTESEAFGAGRADVRERPLGVS